ncbi:MAG: hypothetical protein AMXMBFR22_06360 [Phycisphaerae bacterium]
MQPAHPCGQQHEKAEAEEQGEDGGNESGRVRLRKLDKARQGDGSARARRYRQHHGEQQRKGCTPAQWKPAVLGKPSFPPELSGAEGVAPRPADVPLKESHING